MVDVFVCVFSFTTIYGGTYISFESYWREFKIARCKTCLEKVQDYDVGVLRKALKVFKSRKGIIPTIIFDVDHGASGPKHKNIIQDVRIMAKDLYDIFRCIIVISEVYAIFEFGKDKREAFIHIDEMTYEESENFLSYWDATFTEEQMKQINEKIGGNPIFLKQLQKSLESASLEESLEALVHDARDDRPFLVSFEEEL